MKRWYSILYVQVLIAIAIGVLVGYFYPKTGATLVVSRWERELDAKALHEALGRPGDIAPPSPAQA
jgi:hypothetical protein